MAKLAIVVVLLVATAATQSLYDRIDIKTPEGEAALPSPALIRSLDLGLHSAAASFFWINAMPELIGLTDTHAIFLEKLELVNTIEPRFAFPYAFTTLVLPFTKKYSERIEKTIEIGERGITEAAPDWRIPFYLAVTYHLESSDPGVGAALTPGSDPQTRAAELFDLAARTRGAPEHIVRFALNYPTLSKNIRAQTKALWETIRDNARDEESKARAEAYLYRLDIVELVERAASVYHQKFGEYPETLDELVERGVLPEIPEDPFGFTFTLREDGSIKLEQ